MELEGDNHRYLFHLTNQIHCDSSNTNANSKVQKKHFSSHPFEVSKFTFLACLLPFVLVHNSSFFWRLLCNLECSLTYNVGFFMSPRHNQTGHLYMFFCFMSCLYECTFNLGFLNTQEANTISNLEYSEEFNLFCQNVIVKRA